MFYSSGKPKIPSFLISKNHFRPHIKSLDGVCRLNFSIAPNFDNMSFADKDPSMIHAAVNTDPLQSPMIDASKSHYGLKERNIPHVKITEKKDLQAWYDFGEKLGEGGFGKVIEVIEITTRRSWAMKTVSKQAGGIQEKLVQQELHVLKMIQHPHIIFLYKVYESNKTIYLLFERCRTDLTRVYHKNKPFPENIARKIIGELVDAVAYLHKYEIVHRDLKMENILLGKNPADPNDQYYIKLTDFGLSISKYGKGSVLHDVCGTLHYMAPEIITKRSYTQTCDMWSIGVLLYMLVFGDYPFNATNERDIQRLICTEQPNFEGSNLSKEATNLILLLLEKDPVKRSRATEVLIHPWLLNKKLSTNVEFNIMEKMKEWKAEMTVERGATSDWVDDSVEHSASRKMSKEPLSLPRTNINFVSAHRLFQKKKETNAGPSERRRSNRQPIAK